MQDTEETKVYCEECNGYLWSVSRREEILGKLAIRSDTILRKCPYQKDCLGNCTGNLKHAR